MGRPTRRTFSPEQKLEAVLRLVRGEPLTALSRELAVDHTTIYRWRDQFLLGGLAALQTGGRSGELAAAEQRISELERALGRKTMELEIAGKALRRLA